MKEERCLYCNKIIPEGRQVCSDCENKVTDGITKSKLERLRKAIREYGQAYADLKKSKKPKISKTKFNYISDDWKRVKNHCRTTDNKDFSDKETTDTFKQKLLISEHSPIRLIEFDWSWKGIYYWVSTEWSRHKFEKFISSQRDDRLKDEIPRGEKRQDALVNFDGYANMQNLIDAWRKRLCFKATKEARELAEDFKVKLHETNPIESDMLQPNCIYRCGCPEFESCGYWKKFKKEYSSVDLSDILVRYSLANDYFYDRINNKK